MKSIILAAGQGTRLRPLTDDRPKCMVEFNGTPLLHYQINTLKESGITGITVIAGYREDKIDIPGVSKIINERYAETNMVATLFTAEPLMDGRDDLIISYGDIIFEKGVIDSLIKSDAELCVISDREWRRYWSLRMENPLEDAETFKVKNDRVIELGKKPGSYEDIQGQYIGLIKVRADMVQKFRSVRNSMDRTAVYDGKDFDNMYMTSFIQHLIDQGWHVKPVWIDNGWLEVDSVEDLRQYEKMLKDSTLAEIIRIV